MMTYLPGSFGPLAETPLGQRLWRFLIQPENIARLETGSDLGRPALEALQEPLLAEFKEAVLDDRVKQMLGHMVRQIMEQRGWILDQGDVKVRSIPFTKAARYRRLDSVELHAFRNTRDARDVAIALGRTPTTLPGDTSWRFYCTFSRPVQAAVLFGVTDLQALRRQIEKDGYARVRVERVTRAA
jgi:hypothetical protein